MPSDLSRIDAMGKCKYCQKPAGFLRSSHSECRESHREITKAIPQFISDAIESNAIDGLEADLKSMQDQGFVEDAQMEKLAFDGLGRAVDLLLDDHVLTAEEEERLERALAVLPVREESMGQADAVKRMVRASVLRNLAAGEPFTHKFNAQGLPFLFQKSEELVWAFSDVTYFENRTRTEYVGGSHGVSVRITKGVYYRTGRFKGERVQTEELHELGTGFLALTTKHIYFHSSQRAFKVPYRKIVSLETFEDGIRVQRDGTTTRPQVFQGVDGWFCSNVISNASE